MHHKRITFMREPPTVGGTLKCTTTGQDRDGLLQERDGLLQERDRTPPGSDYARTGLLQDRTMRRTSRTHQWLFMVSTTDLFMCR